jgi:hypothetical protein
MSPLLIFLIFSFQYYNIKTQHVTKLDISVSNRIMFTVVQSLFYTVVQGL